METTSFDLLTKTLVAESRSELVAWLSGRTPLAVDLVPTALVRTDVVVSDQIVRAELPGDPPTVRYFHVELQTAGDPKMASRMLEYWARANRRFREIERCPITVSSCVIYLTRKRFRQDPGELRADDGEGTDCLFRYRVMKLWEQDPGLVLRMPRPGLAPLAPLMATEDPVGTVVESKQKILEAGDAVLPARKKAELCFPLSVPPRGRVRRPLRTGRAGDRRHRAALQTSLGGLDGTRRIGDGAVAPGKG
jgi:hypothetical protein